MTFSTPTLALSKLRVQRTRFALVWMHLASEPFLALYTTLLAFILRKDLGANAFQLSVLVTLKPVLALLSFYWGSRIHRHRHKVVSNLICAWILARLPFVFFPLFPSIWYLIFSAGIYELFNRAATPASMEILKINLEKSNREHLFSLVYLLSFLESILLGFFVGKILTFSNNSWPYLFMATSLLSISSVIFQKRISLPTGPQTTSAPNTFKERLVDPWKESYQLMKEQKEFAQFQVGFMIGGFGLMLIAPAIVIYFAETLMLSHESLTFSRYIWMGVGISFSTLFWKKAMGSTSIGSLTKKILLGFSLYPLLLYFAKDQSFFLHLAFLSYGIAQAGSHLLWHLSGTMFAKEGESSSKYTTVNILMVGLRGAVAPFLGGTLTTLIGAAPVLLIGSFTCLLGFFYMVQVSKKDKLSHDLKLNDSTIYP